MRIDFVVYAIEKKNRYDNRVVKKNVTSKGIHALSNSWVLSGIKINWIDHYVGGLFFIVNNSQILKYLTW